MTTKKLSELEVLEALGEETYAVVEENGEAKRYPAGGFGAVKSVNGVTPDEAGNVAVEIPECFSGRWNDLTGRPFGESVTETNVVNTTSDSVFDDIEDLGYYNHVEYDGVVYPLVSRGSTMENGFGVCGNTKLFAYDGDTLSAATPVVDTGEPFCFVDDIGSIVGFNHVNEGVKTVNMRFFRQKTVSVPIEEKYIPDTIARMSDIPEVPEHTWESLPDKPFGEVGQELYNGIPPWDGMVASISGVPLRLGVKYSFYLRLEDGTEKKMNVTAVEDNYGKNIACTYTDGEYDFEFYYHPMYKGNTLYIRGSKWLENASTYNLRICFRYVEDAYLEMDSKYLPKVASISDVSDVPTAEEFNALLAVLRAAGYMNS